MEAQRGERRVRFPKEELGFSKPCDRDPRLQELSAITLCPNLENAAPWHSELAPPPRTLPALAQAPPPPAPPRPLRPRPAPQHAPPRPRTHAPPRPASAAVGRWRSWTSGSTARCSTAGSEVTLEAPCPAAGDLGRLLTAGAVAAGEGGRGRGRPSGGGGRVLWVAIPQFRGETCGPLGFQPGPKSRPCRLLGASRSLCSGSLGPKGRRSGLQLPSVLTTATWAHPLPQAFCFVLFFLQTNELNSISFLTVFAGF